jgi:hypothetical protein
VRVANGNDSCCSSASAKHAFSAVQAFPTLCNLLQVRISPWHHLVATAEDMGWLQLIGVTWAEFNHLLTVFLPLIEPEDAVCLAAQI